MKLLIASDLHGSAYYTQMLLAREAQEAPEKLICWVMCSTTARETTCRGITRRSR